MIAFDCVSLNDCWENKRKYFVLSFYGECDEMYTAALCALKIMNNCG